MTVKGQFKSRDRTPWTSSPGSELGLIYASLSGEKLTAALPVDVAVTVSLAALRQHKRWRSRRIQPVLTTNWESDDGDRLCPPRPLEAFRRYRATPHHLSSTAGSSCWENRNPNQREGAPVVPGSVRERLTGARQTRKSVMHTSHQQSSSRSGNYRAEETGGREKGRGRSRCRRAWHGRRQTVSEREGPAEPCTGSGSLTR